MNGDKWEDYGVEINHAGRMTLFQTEPRFGDYMCTTNKVELNFNRDRVFTINKYLVLNSTHVTDMTGACKGLNAISLQDVTKGINSMDLEPCFNEVKTRRVYLRLIELIFQMIFNH